MKIAVVVMGYADGLPRSLSGGVGKVMLDGRYAPIIGNVCMDQAIIDVSDIPAVAAGDTAVLIGRCQEAQISAVEFAEWAGTIPNEVLARMGAHGTGLQPWNQRIGKRCPSRGQAPIPRGSVYKNFTSPTGRCVHRRAPTIFSFCCVTYPVHPGASAAGGGS